MDPETLRKKLSEALTDKTKAGALLSEVDDAIVQLPMNFSSGPVRKELFDIKRQLTEYYYDGMPYVSTYGAKSFKDLRASAAAQEAASSARELAAQYSRLIDNIMGSEDASGAKVSALRTLGEEFIGEITTALQVQGEAAAPKPLGDALVESTHGAAVTLAEVEAPASGNRSPLNLNVKLIVPGWGNQRDLHYYSRELLKRDAHIFEGVKMYASDHKAEEKSVRNEVSIIKSIEGFADDGAPIARVTVIDPGFAEMVRNRAAVGELGSLECSILAYGSAKKGKAPDGREGNIVEAITSAQSVDWVTKAGAGGKAISLAESAASVKGKDMDTVADFKLFALGLAEKVKLAEVEVDPADLDAIINALTALKGPAPAATAAAADATANVADAVAAASEVAAVVEKSSLPALAKARVAAGEYRTLAEVDAAITAEADYLKKITGSGRPHNPAATAAAKPVALAERSATVDKLIDKAFGHSGPVRK